MGRAYIHDDFLLETKAAKRLYHEYAADLPIIDYHCHLPPWEIGSDRRWDNIAQIWLYGDHYKWRAMRSNGIAERFCTGNATDREKYDAWARTLPYLVRNQLYPWTHLELARYFGIDGQLLGPETADEIWEKCNAVLQEEWFSAHGILKKFNVVALCTTDDPTDMLEHHRAVAWQGSLKTKVLPTWRPDKGMAVENPKKFNEWVDKLASVSDVEIKDFGSYMTALRKRHDFFNQSGCRLSDHGIETFYATDYTDAEITAVFDKIRGGSALDESETTKFKSAMLFEFAVMDHERGWAQQFHYGVLRNNNTRLHKMLGPDIGCDSVGDFGVARACAALLNRLDAAGKLARTILYNINPRDNALMATMLGNFQDGSVAGKIQHGSAWWMLDTCEGMTQQMVDLSQNGLLSHFVGMLTDSRSFLSYPRHEFFRRVLANLLGGDMERGYIPGDFELVGRMVKDISYNNAARYFGVQKLPD
jgi:glucuronate isomerase